MNTADKARAQPEQINASHVTVSQWDTLGAETADFGNYFRAAGRAAVSSKPDARDTVKWLTMPVYGLIDRPRATQRCCSAGASEVSPFYTSLLWLRQSLFSAQVRVAVVGPGSESFATRVRRLF